VPDSEKQVADNIIQVWQLPKSDRGYWLQCNYANTTAQIVPVACRRASTDATSYSITTSASVAAAATWSRA